MWGITAVRMRCALWAPCGDLIRVLGEDRFFPGSSLILSWSSSCCAIRNQDLFLSFFFSRLFLGFPVVADMFLVMPFRLPYVKTLPLLIVVSIICHVYRVSSCECSGLSNVAVYTLALFSLLAWNLLSLLNISGSKTLNRLSQIEFPEV